MNETSVPDCLANTGTQADIVILVIGLLLLSVGAAAVVLTRRRGAGVAAAALLLTVFVAGASLATPTTAHAAIDCFGGTKPTSETPSAGESATPEPTSTPEVTPTPTPTPEPTPEPTPVDARASIVPGGLGFTTTTVYVDNAATAQNPVPVGSVLDVNISFVGSDLSVVSIDPRLNCPSVAPGQTFTAVDVDPGPASSVQGTASFSCTTTDTIPLGDSASISTLLVEHNTTEAIMFTGYNGANVGVTVPTSAIDMDPSNNMSSYIWPV